jgi:regulator of replication initiation timing
MQKVVTIDTNKLLKQSENAKSRQVYEYPDLNKLLEEGYHIVNTFQNENAQTITFILSKKHN